MEKRLRSTLETSASKFLTTITQHPFKSIKPSLKTLIHSLPPNPNSLPSSLHKSIQRSISQFQNPNTSSPNTPPSKRIRRSNRNTAPRKNDAVSPPFHNLHVYTYILHLCLSHPNKTVFPIPDLFPIVRLLHDNLILFESDTTLLSEIGNLCEEWWKCDLLGKESLISQSLPVILSRSLTLKKKVDVRRVYSLREAFVLFDFEDESIEDLRHLLMRCVISPLYLKTDEGRRFLSFVIGLSVQLAKDVFAMVKSQIPYGRKSVLEAYGEVVFRAWKGSVGECREEIETGFLEGLVEGAVYAGTDVLAASIRRVLGEFVNCRTTEGVEKLIFRLAEPIIFRSLQVFIISLYC